MITWFSGRYATRTLDEFNSVLNTVMQNNFFKITGRYFNDDDDFITVTQVTMGGTVHYEVYFNPSIDVIQPIMVVKYCKDFDFAFISDLEEEIKFIYDLNLN